jgi:hypothetical protein
MRLKEALYAELQRSGCNGSVVLLSCACTTFFEQQCSQQPAAEFTASACSQRCAKQLIQLFI